MTEAENAAARMRRRVQEEPARSDDPPHVVGRLTRLCRTAATILDADGVGLSVVASDGAPAKVAASDPRSSDVEELQFTLGEGPCRDVFESGQPVLCPDLSELRDTRWPGYAAAVQEHGVRAVFAFPLQVGAARLGALDVYRDRAGSLGRDAEGRALLLADLALQSLVTAGANGDPSRVETAADVISGTHEIYQAQGIVMVELGVDIVEAMVRLRAYAYAHDRPLIDVAHDVVTRTLHLKDDAP